MVNRFTLYIVPKGGIKSPLAYCSLKGMKSFITLGLRITIGYLGMVNMPNFSVPTAAMGLTLGTMPKKILGNTS